MVDSVTDTQEIAARAVRAFSRMTPGLTSYVRAITGKPDLVVRAAPITSTDGHFVNIRPPLILADQSDHDRLVCDKRGEDKMLLCPACRRIEMVWSCLYHETSHIVCGSLAKRPIADLVSYAIGGAKSNPDTERVMTKYLDHFATESSKAGVISASVYEIASAAHPYLLGVLRATDDYVIESAAMQARPGVGRMLYHLHHFLLTLDVNEDDGTPTSWKDQPIESQLVIALLTELHGWGLEDKFSSETIEVIRSPGIQALMDREIPDVDSALAAAAAYLAEFNRQGYLLAEEPEEPDASETDESDGDSSSDDEGQDQDDSGGGGNSDSDGSGNGQDGDGQAGQGGGDPRGDDGNPDSSGDDPADSNSSGASGNSPVDDGQESSGAGNSGGHGAGNPGANNPGGKARGGRQGKTSPEQIEKAMDKATGHEMNHKLMEDGYAQGQAYGEASEFDPYGLDTPMDSDSASGVDEGPDGPGNYEVDMDLVTREEMDLAVSQALHFDTISRQVGSVELFRDTGHALAEGQTTPIRVDESTVAGSLMRARRVFSDNAMDKHIHGLKKGKLSPRSLGARGWGDDHRLFRKKIRADATDYEVVIGADVSGSTTTGAIKSIREAVYAMGELLARTNIPFSVYAHTTSRWSEVMMQHMYEIKRLGDPWNDETKTRLSRMRGSAGSLDGHNFEFYRKRLDRSQAVKKLCVYYTDGVIPETNHYEEASIMERESALYRRLGYEALIVPVGRLLSNPYGFDQVLLRDSGDLITVLDALEKKLTKGHL